MKKFFILALFVLGMYNASAFAMAQEIILTELYSIMPLDDPGDNGAGGRPNPNLIIATIDGDQLSIDAGADEHPYVEVVAPETGEVVAEEEFEGETTMSIPDEGNYEVYIYTESGSVMMGEFEVE
ncbi:MAG: hypothetical protein E7075_06955 [Bacteroidales bacterium]|nr:hypothetical protein [Bacteroidales bacterium]